MRNFPVQTGPVGEPVSDSNAWTSSNANDTFQETQNTITDTGQVLINVAAAADNSQLSQAIARNAAAATFYTDSGTTNVYVLSTLGAFKSPTVYLDGQIVRWIAGNANTGASTIDVSSVGVKGLVAEGGGTLSSGAIDTTIENQARYSLGNDRFELIRAAGTGGLESVVDDTTPQLGGALDGQDFQAQKINLLDYGEITNAIGSIGGGTQDINLELGNSVSGTVDTSATTFTFSNPTASDELSGFTFTLTNGGSQTVIWPASVDWAGGTAPTLTVAGVDILTFFTIDGGTIFHGMIASTDSK